MNNIRKIDPQNLAYRYINEFLLSTYFMKYTFDYVFHYSLKVSLVNLSKQNREELRSFVSDVKAMRKMLMRLNTKQLRRSNSAMVTVASSLSEVSNPNREQFIN